ncbi:MAG: DUF881 domain-containing protein [Actinobacteria bacterium]|nr:DUF881 domain-containing protein [Actinomycetota bacterium]
MKEVLEIIDRQARRTRISIAIICFLLGFLLVTQIKGQMAAAKPLQEESEKNLVELARGLRDEVTIQKAESATLNLQLYKVERVANDKKSVIEEVKKTRDRFVISTGVVGVEGRGVRITINDDRGRLNGIDLFDVLTELRAAGAEAIAVEGQRVNVATSFSRRDNMMFMGDRRIEVPYIIEAIGDPETIYQALTMVGGIRDTLTSSVPGVSFEIATTAMISLPGGETPKYEFARAVTE